MILEHAPKLSPDAFGVMMRKWREYADDLEAKDETSKAFEERFFRLTDTLDGAKVDGFLDPEAAALVRSALDAIDRPDPTNGLVKPRSLGQRYADALVDLATRILGPHRSGEAGSSRTSTAVLDVNRVAGHEPVDIFGDPGVPGYGDAIGRRPVSPETIERLLCDCNIGRVLMRGESEVLDVGRRSRTRHPGPMAGAAPPRQDTAGSPAVTGPPNGPTSTTSTRWIDGGRTDLDNLVLLCRYHHVLCHEGGWTLTRTTRRHDHRHQTRPRPPHPTPPPPRRGPPDYTLAA